MTKTAVEWLIQKIELSKNEDGIYCMPFLYNFEIEQAKQMEAEQQQKMVDDALTNYELGWSDRKKQFSMYEHKETITSADTKVSTSFLENTPTSSQTEISDEEIEELTIKKFYELQKKRKTLHHWSWVNGMKMYREQLKQK